MSKIIATAVMRGTRKLVNQAEELLEKTIKDKGEGNFVNRKKITYLLMKVKLFFHSETLK